MKFLVKIINIIHSFIFILLGALSFEAAADPAPANLYPAALFSATNPASAAVLLDSNLAHTATSNDAVYYYWEKAYTPAGTTGNCDLKMRIYGKINAYPYKKALMYFHDRDASGNLYSHLDVGLKDYIDAGFLAFMPACRLAQSDAAHAFDDALALIDANNAVDPVLEANPQISVMGNSAGGHLAVWLASQTSYQHKIPAVLAWNPDSNGYAVVDLAVPMFILRYAKDEIVTPEQGVALCEAQGQIKQSDIHDAANDVQVHCNDISRAVYVKNSGHEAGTDNDGAPYRYEMLTWLNAIVDPNYDSDQDGITDRQEFLFGFNLPDAGATLQDGKPMLGSVYSYDSNIQSNTHLGSQWRDLYPYLPDVWTWKNSETSSSYVPLSTNNVPVEQKYDVASDMNRVALDYSNIISFHAPIFFAASQVIHRADSASNWNVYVPWRIFDAASESCKSLSGRESDECIYNHAISALSSPSAGANDKNWYKFMMGAKADLDQQRLPGKKIFLSLWKFAYQPSDQDLCSVDDHVDAVCEQELHRRLSYFMNKTFQADYFTPWVECWGLKDKKSIYNYRALVNGARAANRSLIIVFSAASCGNAAIKSAYKTGEPADDLTIDGGLKGFDIFGISYYPNTWSGNRKEFAKNISDVLAPNEGNQAINRYACDVLPSLTTGSNPDFVPFAFTETGWLSYEGSPSSGKDYNRKNAQLQQAVYLDFLLSNPLRNQTCIISSNTLSKHPLSFIINFYPKDFIYYAEPSWFDRIGQIIMDEPDISNIADSGLVADPLFGNQPKLVFGVWSKAIFNNDYDNDRILDLDANAAGETLVDYISINTLTKTRMNYDKRLVFVDNCPAVSNSTQVDSDGDGVGNACDNCPHDLNADQIDSDYDGIGDACDKNNDSKSDLDNDGLKDSFEAINGLNPVRSDTDGDGVNDGEDACRDFRSLHASKDCTLVKLMSNLLGIPSKTL